jgi:hypothetical protein
MHKYESWIDFCLPHLKSMLRPAQKSANSSLLIYIIIKNGDVHVNL